MTPIKDELVSYRGYCGLYTPKGFMLYKCSRTLKTEEFGHANVVGVLKDEGNLAGK